MKTQKPFYTVLNEYFTELFTEHPAKASVDISDASQLQADLAYRLTRDTKIKITGALSEKKMGDSTKRSMQVSAIEFVDAVAEVEEPNLF